MRATLCMAALVAALIGLTGSATAQDGSSGLYVSHGIAKYGWSSREGAARHTLRLKASVLRTEVLDGLEAGSEVEVLLGTESVFAVGPETEGARVRLRGKRRWTAKLRGTPGGTGKRRLKLDLRRGTLLLRIGKADLTGMRQGALTDLPVVLRAGSRSARTTVSFKVRAGASPERWDLLRPGTPGGGGGGTGGGGGDPGGDPGGGTDRILSLNQIVAGTRSDIGVRSMRVARTQTEWNQLWAQHAPGGSTPPAMDFSSDMVVGVFHGLSGTSTGPTTTGIKVSCVRENGSRVLVTWEQVPNVTYNGCPPPGQKGPCVVATPFHFVSVGRSTLTVQFAEAAAGTGCQ